MNGEKINCNKLSVQFLNPSMKKNGFYYIYNRDEKKIGVLVLFDQNLISKSDLMNSKYTQLDNKGIFGYN